MPGELNNETTADSYTNATTATAPSTVRVRIYVRNASIYYQYGYGGRGGGVDFSSHPERFLLPGNYSFDETERPFDQVRVRSATPGVPASVTVDCVPSPGPGRPDG